MSKVLFLNRKSVGKYMAGPGIRAFELARVLSRDHEVKIGGPQILWADIIIVPIYSMDFIWLMLAKLLGKRIVVDAYFVPFFETAEKYAFRPKLAEILTRMSRVRTRILFKLADRVLCASERQKELWLEWLSKLGRGGKVQIDLVPTGISGEPLSQKQPLFKGVVPGINMGDTVVLWASGIWPWFDPFTAIKAMRLIKEPAVKLIFFGLRPTDEYVKGESTRLQSEAIELSKRLGLYNKSVFFIEERVPYDRIGDYLLDSDIALNVQKDTLETRYAFRTRVLDYLRAGLPVVATEGDVLADEIKKRGMGIVVNYGSEIQIAEAILKLRTDRALYENCRKNMKEFVSEMEWSRVAAPLKEYCAV